MTHEFVRANKAASEQPIVRRTDRTLHVDVTRYLMPVDADDQPCWVRISEHTDELFIPVFSTFEKYKSQEAVFALVFDRLVQIEDANGFIQSVRGHRIAVDMHPHKGNTRFTEIFHSEGSG